MARDRKSNSLVIGKYRSDLSRMPVFIVVFCAFPQAVQANADIFCIPCISVVIAFLSKSLPIHISRSSSNPIHFYINSAVETVSLNNVRINRMTKSLIKLCKINGSEKSVMLFPVDTGWATVSVSSLRTACCKPVIIGLLKYFCHSYNISQFGLIKNYEFYEVYIFNKIM